MIKIQMSEKNIYKFEKEHDLANSLHSETA